MYSDEYYLNQLSYFLVFIPIFARKYTIMITEELQKLYLAYTGVPAENITELPSSGSNRRYFRLAGVQTLIGVYGTCIDENEAFLYMAAHFRRCGLPIPEIHIVSEDKTYYLQEDLGDTLLFHAIEKGRATSVFSEDEKELLRKTIRLLPAIQFAGADGFDFSRCYPQPEFNQRSILWDLNYFKYCFLKATGMEFQEDKLEDDFQKMSDVLLRSSSATFMTLLLSYGRQKQNILIVSVRNCCKNILKHSANTNQLTNLIFIASFAILYFSVLCKCLEPMAFVATSKRSPTLSRVFLMLSGTCANC